MAARYFYVKDRTLTTSTTTGTGDFTLSGTPVDGYTAFAMPGGAWMNYSIVAVDSSGAPTGDYEVGLGRENSGALSRVVVYQSTNGGGKVDWPAGTKHVGLVVPAFYAGSIKRHPPYTGMDFYVDATGDDNAEGIDPAVGPVDPVLTLEGAFDRINEYSFPPDSTVTINIGAGTFSTAYNLRVRADGPDSITLVGAGAGTTTIGTVDVSGDKMCLWSIEDMTVSGGVVVRSNQSVTIADTVEIEAGDGYAQAVGAGAFVTLASGVTVTGDPNIGFSCFGGGALAFGGDVDFPSGVTVGTALVMASDHSIMYAGDFVKTGAGSVTGKRYESTYNGIIDTSGGGATFFPGTVSGTTGSGGQYL